MEGKQGYISLTLWIQKESGKIVLPSLCTLEHFLNHFTLNKVGFHYVSAILKSPPLDPLPPSYLKRTTDSEFPQTFDVIPYRHSDVFLTSWRVKCHENLPGYSWRGWLEYTPEGASCTLILEPIDVRGRAAEPPEPILMVDCSSLQILYKSWMHYLV